MYKVGPSLVALDEVTGQVKWAYGPMVASSEEEARMRFEATPAGGPGSIYATYILDNIEGDSHIDTEYGVMAFDAASGRVRWRREICRLQPGQFAAGFAERRRNRIRSFSSSPLYHEGTVYACTHAGSIAALDALSGRIKWLTRYPYWPAVHDATRAFGGLPEWSGTVFTHGMHEPSFWFGQRPWIVGDRLFVLPVDSTMMHCLDRRTGKVEWSWVKRGGNYTYVLGPTSEGYLVVATSGRGGIVHLLDPNSGKTVWTSPDPILAEDHPVMVLHHDPYGSAVPGGFNNRGFFLMARPFLTSDDRLYTTYYIDCGFNLSPWCTSLAEISLRDRKVLNRRRYYLPAYQAFIADCIARAAGHLQQLQELPFKDDRIKEEIRGVEAICKDTVPQNTYGPFVPFSRITFERFGTPFELRFTVRTVEMLYDWEVVKRNLAGRNDPEGLFAKAELALSEHRLKEAAELMRQALTAAPPEDLDFRAAVNQQLYLVYKRLAQSSVRSGQVESELAYCLGMSQTVGSLADEMETLVALSEAYERRGDYRTAARMVQRMIYTYGQHEYELPSLLIGEHEALMALSHGVLDKAADYMKDSLYASEVARPAMLAKRMLRLYFSALSPLRKDLNVRAGELGAQRLLTLRAAWPQLAKELDQEAAEVLAKQTPSEQLLRLWEFPGTAIAQKVLEDLLAQCSRRRQSSDISLEEAAELRRREWALADAARVAGLRLPEEARVRLLAPPAPKPAAAIELPLAERSLNLEETRGPAWLVLERHGRQDLAPDCIFLSGRVRKKLDNKFLLYCVDLQSGTIRWKAQEKRGEQWFDEIRLGEKGSEPGFFDAFVWGEVVVTHGMNDVLAFSLEDGKLRWRYTTPYGFEIKHAILSGDLLILVGHSETLALYMGTQDPRGEVAWQTKEEGLPYVAPYLVGDRLVSLRKMPGNLTVRYRSTGRLIGRLALPDLTLFDEHPLIENGPHALPVAHDGTKLVVTDCWYYFMIDVEKMCIVWKRLIDQNDATRLPPMRFAMRGRYLAVVKQDYDVKTIYMLDSDTGEILWKTDPKVPSSPQPLNTILIVGDRLYGIRLHPGQGFYFAGVDCKTGGNLFPMNEQAGYGGKPEAALLDELYGKVAVVRVRDRQDFELKAFDSDTGKLLHTVKVQGTGDFGEHGRVSATVQNGKLVLLGQNDLRWVAKK
ncbi:MAG: outer membrane protein assembly factor BamB family protein [Kiritimatiellia bacterium]